MTHTRQLLLAAAIAAVADAQYAVDPLGLLVIRRIGRLNETTPQFRETTVENVVWSRLQDGTGYLAGPPINLVGMLLDTVTAPLHGAVRLSGDRTMAVVAMTKTLVNSAYSTSTSYDMVVATIDPTQIYAMTARPQASQLGLLPGGLWMCNRTGPALATWWYDYGAGPEGRPVSPTGSSFSWSTTGTFFQMPSPAPLVLPRENDMPSQLTLQHQAVWGGDLYSVTVDSVANDVLVVYRQPLPTPYASAATLTNFTVNAQQAWAVIPPANGGLPSQYRVVGMAHMSTTVVWFAGRAATDDTASHLFAVNVTGPAIEYFQGTAFPATNAAFLFVVTPPASSVLDIAGRWECGTYVLYALFTSTIMLVDGATGLQLSRYAIPDALNLPPVSLTFMPNATGCSSGTPFTPECAADQQAFCAATVATPSPTPAVSSIPPRSSADLLLVTVQYAAYRSNLSAVQYVTATGGTTCGVSLATRLWVADSVVPTVLKATKPFLSVVDPRGVVRACTLPITDLQRDSVVQLTSTSDRQFALLPCFDVLPANRTQVDEFMVPAVARVYARIRADLSTDFSTVASGDDGTLGGVPNRYPRNLASVDGSVVYAPSWAVISTPAQLNVVPAGAFYDPPSPALQTPVASMYGVLIINDTLFGVWKNASGGPAQLWQVGTYGELPVVGATGVSVSPACVWNNLSPVSSFLMPVVDHATNTFYFGAQAAITVGTCGSRLLTPLLVLPYNGSANIVSLAGRQEAVGFVLYAVLRETFISTDTGMPTIRTAVYRIPAGLAPGEVPTMLQQRVCTGNASEIDLLTGCMEFRSVTFVPVSPTPSVTPSRSPSTPASGSATPSPSWTPSVAASSSQKCSLTPSVTLSPSGSSSIGAGGAAGGDGVLVPPGAAAPDVDPLFIAIGGGAAAALLGVAFGRCACIIRINRARREQVRKTQRWQQLRADTKTQRVVADVLQQLSGNEGISVAASRANSPPGPSDASTASTAPAAPARRRVIADPRSGAQVEVELSPAASKVVIEAVVLETLDSSMQALRSRALSSRNLDDQRTKFLPQKASGGAATQPGSGQPRNLAASRGASGRFSVVSPLQQRAAGPPAVDDALQQVQLDGLMELVGFIAGEVAADVLDVQSAVAESSAQPQHHRKASIAVQRAESSGVSKVELGKRQKAGYAPAAVQHAATVQQPTRLLTPSARLERIEDISRRAAAQPNVPLPVARQHADIKRIVTAAYATGEGAADAAAARIAGIPLSVPRQSCVPVCGGRAHPPDGPHDTMMLFVDDALRVAAKAPPSVPVAVSVHQPDIPTSAQTPAAPRTTSVRVALEVDGSPGLPVTQSSSKTAMKRQSVFSGGGALGGKFQANPLRSTSRQVRR